MRSSSREFRGIQDALFLIVFLIYLLTQAETIVWRDSAEFTVVAWGLDIAHSPGSPTFALFGKLVTLLPLGSIPFRVSLLSTFCSAVAAWFLFLWCSAVVRRIFGRVSGGAIAVGVLAFSLSRSAWEWGNAQEVYALRDLFFAAIGYLWVTGRYRPAAFLWGLSLGAHITMVLFVPGYLCAILLGEGKGGRPAVKEVLLWVTLAILGGSVFLYLPLRSGAQLPLDIGDPQTWGRMIRHMFVTSDASARMSLYLGRLPVQLHRFGGWIVEEFSLPLLLAGLLGWGLICHRVPRLGISHLLLFFGIVGFFIRTWTRPFGFVPGFMVYALAIAVGVQWLRGRLPARLLPLFLLLLAGLLVRNGVRHGRMNRKFDTARRHALAIARSLPQGALLFSANDNVSLSIAYLRFVEGRRPDLSHVHRSILFDRRRRPWQWPHMQPECIPTGYDPGRAQETLLPAVRRNLPVCPAFWDYGRDEDRYIPVTFLLPHGILFRITAEPLPLSAGVFDEQERWFAPFRRIVADLDPADWTGVENYVRVWNILGEYYDRRGDRKAAERAFREALSIAPEDPTALTNLGSLHARRGAWETAAALFERAIEADPTYLLAYDHLAAVSVACHAYDRAVELLETSLRIAPDQPEIRLRLARIELERGNPDAAARQLDLLRDAPPRIREAAARERPKVDFLRGECDRLLQEPSLLRPDDPEHLFIAGVCAARAGRIDLARRRLEAARGRCIGPCEERGFGNQIRTILRNLQDAQHDERGKRKP